MKPFQGQLRAVNHVEKTTKGVVTVTRIRSHHMEQYNDGKWVPIHVVQIDAKQGRAILKKMKAGASEPSKTTPELT